MADGATEGVDVGAREGVALPKTKGCPGLERVLPNKEPVVDKPVMVSTKLKIPLEK